jgi:hypothetical protein
LFVDWFGVTVLKVVAAVVAEEELAALAFVELFSANVFCRVWPLIPVTTELTDIAAITATAISHVCFDFGVLWFIWLQYTCFTFQYKWPDKSEYWMSEVDIVDPFLSLSAYLTQTRSRVSKVI